MNKILNKGIQIVFITFILFYTLLYSHLCDNVFRQADSLIVKPETYSLVVKDKTTFKIYLQNNMDRGIAEISLIPESSAFDFEVNPKKMSIPKGRQVYFEITISPKSGIKTGNYTVKFRLVGGGREFKSFTLEGLAQEKKETQIDLSKLPHIKSTEIVPLIDGLLTDECWKKATILSNFSSLQGSEAIYKTWVLLTYDRNNLYIGIYCKDEDIQNLTIEDRVEIIFSHPRDTSSYIISFSPAGNPIYKKYNISKQITEWKPLIKYACTKLKNYWSFEISLPFSEINSNFPLEKEIWSIRINRTKATGVEEKSFWSMDVSGYHNEKEMGKIVLEP